MKIKGQKQNKGKFQTTETSAPHPNSDHPLISLRYVKKSHCLSLCESDDRTAFADKILSLTQMTWAQISTAHRHGLGYEKIANLKDSLAALKDFLSNRGPLTRKEIVDGAGMPKGTIAHHLKASNGFKRGDDKKWSYVKTEEK